jgi:hypothetical protein
MREGSSSFRLEDEMEPFAANEARWSPRDPFRKQGTITSEKRASLQTDSECGSSLVWSLAGSPKNGIIGNFMRVGSARHSQALKAPKLRARCPLGGLC